MVNAEGESSRGVERLRISRARYVEEASDCGRRYGDSWAERTASYGELKRLASFAEDDCAVEDALERRDWNAESAGYTIASVILGSPYYEFTDCEVKELWERQFDDANDPRVNCPYFLRGFIEGAVTYLESHETEIES